MPASDVTVRECTSVEDFKQCVTLEKEVWKDDDLGIMPIRLYMISRACHAPTVGAFDAGGKLVGFVHTMIALMDGNVVYHSHLAAVLEDQRHQDIGFRMKLEQRNHAIRAGVPMIFWTFDPLQSRNAHLNINKLGAVIRRYEPNYYGEGLSTVFEEGVPSDRVFAEWWVSSPHVESVLAGKVSRPASIGGTVTIPEDVGKVKAQSLGAHIEWRLKTREAFVRELKRGNIARGFERDSASSESRYLFGSDEKQFHFSGYDDRRT